MRPSTGVVLPRCKVPVQVILVPPQGDGGGAAAAVVDPAKDKFLVQAVRMSKLDGDHGKEAQELFSRAGQGAGHASRAVTPLWRRADPRGGLFGEAKA